MAERDVILTELKLSGQRQYEAGMERAAAATDELEDSIEDVGGTMNRNKRRWLSFGKVVDSGGDSLFRMGDGSNAAARGLKFLSTRVAASGYVIAGLGAAAVAAAPGIFQLFAAAAAAGTAAGGVFLVGAAAIDRFAQTSKQAGTAANRLLTSWQSFLAVFRRTTARGADIFLLGLAKGLRIVGRALEPLRGPMEAFAFAVADVTVAMARGLAGMGPQFGELLRGLVPVIRQLPQVMLPLTQMFLNLAKIGTPALVSLMGVFADFAGWLEKVTRTPPKFGGLFDALKPAAPFLQNILLPLLAGMGRALGETFKFAVDMIGLTARALGWLGKKAEPLKPLFTSLGYALTLFFGPALLGKLKYVGIAFRAIGKAVVWVTGKFGAFGRMVGSFVVKNILAIRALVISLSQNLKDRLGAALDVVSTLYKTVFSGLKRALGSVLGFFIDRWNWFADTVSIGPVKVLGKTVFPGIELPKIGEERALGGPVMPRIPYVVGERGPELFVPRMPGAIVPDAGGMAGLINLTAITQLDGKVLARTTARVTSEQMARR